MRLDGLGRSDVRGAGTLQRSKTAACVPAPDQWPGPPDPMEPEPAGGDAPPGEDMPPAAERAFIPPGVPRPAEAGRIGIGDFAMCRAAEPLERLAADIAAGADARIARPGAAFDAAPGDAIPVFARDRAEAAVCTAATDARRATPLATGTATMAATSSPAATFDAAVHTCGCEPTEAPA